MGKSSKGGGLYIAMFAYRIVFSLGEKFKLYILKNGLGKENHKRLSNMDGKNRKGS